MALVITLYRLVLIVAALGTIRELIMIFLAPMSNSSTHTTGYIIGLLAFVVLLVVMWQRPRTFLQLSTEDIKLLNINFSEAISFQQLAGLAVFLVGFSFFLYGLEQVKNIIVNYYQYNESSHAQGGYYQMILFGAGLFVVLAFAVMYFHRRIVCFFFRR